MVSQHEMMVLWHEMMISWHEMTILASTCVRPLQVRAAEIGFI